MARMAMGVAARAVVRAAAVREAARVAARAAAAKAVVLAEAMEAEGKAAERVGTMEALAAGGRGKCSRRSTAPSPVATPTESLRSVLLGS